MLETFGNAVIKETEIEDLESLFYFILQNNRAIKKNKVQGDIINIKNTFLNGVKNNFIKQRKNTIKNRRKNFFLKTNQKLVSFYLKNRLYNPHKFNYDKFQNVFWKNYDHFYNNIKNYSSLENYKFINNNFLNDDLIDKKCLLKYVDKIFNFNNLLCIDNDQFKYKLKDDELVLIEEIKPKQKTETFENIPSDNKFTKINYNLKSLFNRYNKIYENIYLLDQIDSIDLNSLSSLHQQINFFKKCYIETNFDNYLSTNSFYLEEMINIFLRIVYIKNNFTSLDQNIFIFEYTDCNKIIDILYFSKSEIDSQKVYQELLDNHKEIFLSNNIVYINLIQQDTLNYLYFENFCSKTNLFLEKIISKYFKLEKTLKKSLENYSSLKIFDELYSNMKKIDYKLDPFTELNTSQTKFYNLTITNFRLKIFGDNSIVQIKIENKERVEFHKIFKFEHVLDLSFDLDYLLIPNVNDLILSITCLHNKIIIG